MWSQSVVRVGAHEVGLTIRRLEPPERRQVAASLAWLTLGALHEENMQAWEEGVGDLVGEHVSFTIGVDDPARLDSAWWSALLNAALLQFMRENDLSKLVHDQLYLLQSGSRSEARVS